MEAANLGAWLAGVDDAGLEEVFSILAEAPIYSDPGYMESAQTVLDLYPNGSSSLAVPTWFYGHEPTNLTCLGFYGHQSVANRVEMSLPKPKSHPIKMQHPSLNRFVGFQVAQCNVIFLPPNQFGSTRRYKSRKMRH